MTRENSRSEMSVLKTLSDELKRFEGEVCLLKNDRKKSSSANAESYSTIYGQENASH